MGSIDLPQSSLFKGGSEIFLRNVFENILKTYLRKSPTAKTICELVQSVDNEKICYDHFTFQTLKVDGYGIDSLSSFFMDYGYKIGGGIDFPKNKIRGLWLSPPNVHVPEDGHGLGNGPLPRLVISELLVDELSPESQEIIKKYLKPEGGKQAVLSSALGSLIWEKPTWTDFNQLAKLSAYLMYVSTLKRERICGMDAYPRLHNEPSCFRGSSIRTPFQRHQMITEYLEEKRFKLNSNGGILKVSEDGLLIQVSSMSEKLAVEFADGVTETIPASFIEFTQRLVLPQFKDLPHDQIKEYHRRDDFDSDNANNIFESTRFTSDV